MPTTRQCLKCCLDGDVQLAPFWGSAWVLVTWLRHVRESQDGATSNWDRLGKIFQSSADLAP